jgi:hypothetical protein
VLYRIRRYQSVPDNAAAFHDFFNRYLLPVQRRHGARLIGRWVTHDGEIFAVWEYDDEASYARIQAAVAADPDSARAQEVRKSLGPLFTERTETFARSTLSE